MRLIQFKCQSFMEIKVKIRQWTYYDDSFRSYAVFSLGGKEFSTNFEEIIVFLYAARK